MGWQYLLVFFGAFLFDVVAFPFPPAFTIMVFLQIMFGLNIWWVIVVGVAGSILGRYILTLYIPRLAGRLFKRSKNEDVQFLGKKMKEKGWRGQAVIIAYSLLPLPTTPLFVAGGMAKIHALYIIPAFFVGCKRPIGGSTIMEVNCKLSAGATSSRCSVIHRLAVH